MPTYTFENTETNEVTEEVMTLAQREKHLAENPHVRQLITNPRGFIPGSLKPDEGFRDILREMKRANKGSTIETF